MIMNMGKKIICIKDIPSNLIEEAIFILKPNVTQKKNTIFEEKSKEIILDEAENIVDEYISKIQEKKDSEKENENIRKEELKKEVIYIAGLLIIVSICIAFVI